MNILATLMMTAVSVTGQAAGAAGPPEATVAAAIKAITKDPCFETSYDIRRFNASDASEYVTLAGVGGQGA